MITEDDLKYLKQAGCSESLIQHSIAVTKRTLEIADLVTVSVDRDLLKKGAINHDIGRSKTHELEHFVVGADIARSFGFEEEVVRIIERHIGAGIYKDEAVTLGLPPKDYIPETAEEIIVSYADNLIHHVTNVSFEMSLERLGGRLGKDHPVKERFIDMHKKVLSWMKKDDKI